MNPIKVELTYEEWKYAISCIQGMGNDYNHSQEQWDEDQVFIAKIQTQIDCEIEKILTDINKKIDEENKKIEEE